MVGQTYKLEYVNEDVVINVFVTLNLVDGEHAPTEEVVRREINHITIGLPLTYVVQEGEITLEDG